MINIKENDCHDIVHYNAYNVGCNWVDHSMYVMAIYHRVATSKPSAS